MAVIGFLSYADFLAELRSRPLWGKPIRVQPGCLAVADSEYGPNIRHYTFFVEAAIEVQNPDDQSDILVCRFIIAQTTAISGTDNDKLFEFSERGRWAAKILIQALQEASFIVRPGVITAAAESKTEADPGDLWSPVELKAAVRPADVQ